MTPEQNLEQAQAKLAEAQKQIAEARAQIEAGKSEPWKPKTGDRYWWVPGSTSSPTQDRSEIYCNNVNDRYCLSIGNCFPTKEKANRHMMRMKAAVKKWLPKDGEIYWIVGPKGLPFLSRFIYTYSEHWARYHTGNVHRTEAEAKAWFAEYGLYVFGE